MSQNVKKITLYLFCLKFLGLFSSVIVLTLSAKYFGISKERDIWIIVTSFLFAISGAIFGPLNETFRAKFTHLKEINGKEETERMVGSLIGFIIIVAVIISIVIFLFPDLIMGFVAPSLDDRITFTQMLLILIPSLLLNQLIYIGVGILNIYNIFYLPEIIGFLSGLVNLACIYLLAPSVGIYSLIISQYIYLTIYFIVVLFFIYKTGFRLIPNLFIHWVDIKPFILFSLPFFLPYFLGQCNLILEKSLSNLLGLGVVSVLDYSRKFSTILQAVLTSVLASVMVSDLTKFFSQKDWVRYMESHRKYLEMTILIMCLSLPILIGSADNITQLFFMNSKIDQSGITKITQLMRIYGISFVCISFYLFYGLTMLSQMKGKFYAILGMIGQISIMIINIALYRSLKENAFPIAQIIGNLIPAIIMFKFVKLESRKIQLYMVIKSVLLVILSSAIIYGESLALKEYSSIFTLSVNAFTLLLITFFISLPLIGMKPLTTIQQWIKRT